jgi:hypothetical protein
LAALNWFSGERAARTPLPRDIADTVFDESRTYLRTARLRL